MIDKETRIEEILDSINISLSDADDAMYEFEDAQDALLNLADELHRVAHGQITDANVSGDFGTSYECPDDLVFTMEESRSMFDDAMNNAFSEVKKLKRLAPHNWKSILRHADLGSDSASFSTKTLFKEFGIRA